ncbi:PIG-L family deacetylase [Streptomyces sp. ODS28]|uniref:PIG-L family deacetylase n=1 Tax=Streptomyces sp. ODS28 TaxID=3136688 RepID=UPI0031E83B4D
MGEPSLMCVHAHPDDEALWTGGTLARWADAGARTAVVTCTWTEGTVRAGELARSLDILGAGPPRMLGCADARVPASAPGAPRFVDAPLDETVGQLVAHIREFRPDVLVTYDAYGGYGHEDHVHAHRATLMAAEAAGCAQFRPEAGEPWQPRSLALVTLPRSVVLPLWSAVFGPVEEGTVPGTPDELIGAALDVTAWAGRKRDAALAHASEVERGAGFAQLAGLPEADQARLLNTEWYLRRELAPAFAADGL